MPFLSLALAWAFVLAVPLHLALAAPAKPIPNSESDHRRTVFYVSGQYVRDATAKGTIATNQMYVEQLVPSRGVTKEHPLVFLHGGGLPGTTWLNTPDNRKGWASYFLDQGYLVHLVDIPGVGRSSLTPNTTTYNPSSAETAEIAFTRPENSPNTYPQARLHNQWPGEGIRGDPAFDNWFKSFEPLPLDNNVEEETTAAALCALFKQIGPSYLIAHSYTGIMLFVAADRCPDSIQGLFGVEPNAIPFQSKFSPNSATPQRKWGLTDVAVTYDPPVKDPVTDLKKVEVGENTAANVSCLLQAEPAKKLVNISKVPVAFYTSEASIHIVCDHCMAAYLWQSGVTLDWILLAERGIKGNGHFSFLEKNNLEIAEKIVLPWFELQSGPKGFKHSQNGSATTV